MCQSEPGCYCHRFAVFALDDERAGFHGLHVSTLTDVELSLSAHALSVPLSGSLTVEVDCGRRGDWTVTLPDHRAHLTYPTLDQALRAAQEHAALNRPVELIVRDAYHRVLHRELIGREDDAAIRTVTRPRERRPIRSCEQFPARRTGERREQQGSPAT